MGLRSEKERSCWILQVKDLPGEVPFQGPWRAFLSEALAAQGHLPTATQTGSSSEGRSGEQKPLPSLREPISRG